MFNKENKHLLRVPAFDAFNIGNTFYPGEVSWTWISLSAHLCAMAGCVGTFYTAVVCFRNHCKIRKNKDFFYFFNGGVGDIFPLDTTGHLTDIFLPHRMPGLRIPSSTEELQFSEFGDESRYSLSGTKPAQVHRLWGYSIPDTPVSFRK